ncbi:hypothetical protein DTI93_04185 [Parasaccharibacter sp. TMW 2.1884]|nr:hypothetical protein [Parasaccharibacter sp. TMW 2.1884]
MAMVLPWVHTFPNHLSRIEGTDSTRGYDHPHVRIDILCAVDAKNHSILCFWNLILWLIENFNNVNNWLFL